MMLEEKAGIAKIQPWILRFVLIFFGNGLVIHPIKERGCSSLNCRPLCPSTPEVGEFYKKFFPQLGEEYRGDFAPMALLPWQ
jgi:hypothetical protein